MKTSPRLPDCDLDVFEVGGLTCLAGPENDDTHVVGRALFVKNWA